MTDAADPAPPLRRKRSVRTAAAAPPPPGDAATAESFEAPGAPAASGPAIPGLGVPGQRQVSLAFLICMVIGLVFASLGMSTAPLLHVVSVFGIFLSVIAYPLIGVMAGWPRRPALIERFADNCYYLGFIFTQAALLFSFAPATFSDATQITPETVLRFFGMAVGASLIGLIARTFFIQTSSATAEVSETAQNELTRVARQLTGTISEVVRDFDGLIGQFRNIPSQIDARLATQLDSVGATLNGYDATVRTGMGSFAERRDAFDKSVADAAAGMAAQNQALREELTDAGNAVRSLSASYRTNLDQNLEMLHGLSAGMKDGAQILQSINGIGSDIAALGPRLDAVRESSDGAVRHASEIGTRLETGARELSEQIERTRAEFTQALDAAADDVGQQLGTAGQRVVGDAQARAAAFSDQLQTSFGDFEKAVTAFREELARLRD
ncbi:hypothetical protein [Sphingomonas sp. KR3-1]|uniref:hypothetical protein n=1 Tax=Sphingomonas sp. KR3-1 TaxID=3156611 RepID=UPI0032B470E2